MRELALAREDRRLSTCVQCGFCLPVCPTYTRLGNEADSPRGRIHLMRAVVEQRIAPDDPAFHRHIGSCLGCRACESVCPPGVEFGLLVERAREAIVAATREAPWSAELVLATVMDPVATRLATAALRLLRATRIARLMLRLVPARLSRLRLALAMLEATRPSPILASTQASRRAARFRPVPRTAMRVGVLDGCVQQGLLSRINRATARVLAVNGCEVVAVRGQFCCGALHAHAGHLDQARELARANICAFEDAGVDRIAVNSAGCGAAMKEYPALFEADPEWLPRAQAIARRVADLSELLVELGPVRGAPVALRATYDAPCHLVHAQRVKRAPLAVLEAIPGVELVPLRGADACCGGAGTWGLHHAELARRILDDKLADVQATGAQAVVTPNPGCMMQIGAGLVERASAIAVLHPVELLDESYRRAGFYAGGDAAPDSTPAAMIDPDARPSAAR